MNHDGAMLTLGRMTNSAGENLAEVSVPEEAEREVDSSSYNSQSHILKTTTFGSASYRA